MRAWDGTCQQPGVSDLETREGGLAEMTRWALLGTLLVLAAPGRGPWRHAEAGASEKLDPVLTQVEQRLHEESGVTEAEPNSLAFQRALGEQPARSVPLRQTAAQRVLSLDQCLQQAFLRNREIEQDRTDVVAVGGSKLITNSRFLPSLEIIGQYEMLKDSDASDRYVDSGALSAVLRQRLLEFGKDNPLDISLRQEQREALFSYENTVAEVFSDVRRAFYFIQLKRQQIATRREQLRQFQNQYERKQKRMEAGNLTVKIEVLTARLNMLDEQTRINRLQRQMFNRTMELLRLIGLPVGADSVDFTSQSDSFGLDGFDMDGMVALALAQSSQVALAERLVAEQQRVLDQLKYEYFPDVRALAGLENDNGRVGIDLDNDDDTWGLDLYGQPGLGESDSGLDGLGLFSSESTLSGPDRGWYAGAQVRLPVFEGRAREGRRIQNRAYLQRLRAALADSKDLIELNVRQSFRLLTEQQFQVQLARENVEIERERFSIHEQLRDVGRINDDALETFRQNFFSAQDSLFSQQEVLIQYQENLRQAIRLFR